MGWTTDTDQFIFQKRKKNLSTTSHNPALGLAQFWHFRVTGSISVGIKRPMCEASHAPPPDALIDNVWSSISAPT